MNSEPRKKNTSFAPMRAILAWIQKSERVRIVLQENTSMVIEGVIMGTDQFMNLVLDDAAEIMVKDNNVKKLGRIMLKAENIGFITTPKQ